MAYPKLTGILIALVLISMFAGIFSIMIFQNPYGLGNTTNININKYNRLTDLQSTVQNTSNGIRNVNQQEGIFDLVGGFFSSSFKVLLTIPQSLTLFNDMTEQAILDSNMGTGAIFIKDTLQTIFLILIIIGIILAILLKWVL